MIRTFPPQSLWLHQARVIILTMASSVDCRVEDCHQKVDLVDCCGCDLTLRLRALGWYMTSPRKNRNWLCPEHTSSFGFAQQQAANCHEHLCSICFPVASPSPARVAHRCFHCGEPGCEHYVDYSHDDCCNTWRLRAQGWVRSRRAKHWYCPEHNWEEMRFDPEWCRQHMCSACASSTCPERSSASSSDPFVPTVTTGTSLT